MTDECPLSTVMPITGILRISPFALCWLPAGQSLLQPILNDTVLLKLAFRKGLCNGSGDPSLIRKNLCIIELQKSVQLGVLPAMGHGDVPSGLSGGVIQIHGDDFVQFLHFAHG